MALPVGFDLDQFVSQVLAEDLGTGGDVTSAATIAEDARFTAQMNCREPIVPAGIDIAAAFFRSLDPATEIDQLSSDGDAVAAEVTSPPVPRSSARTPVTKSSRSKPSGSAMPRL